MSDIVVITTSYPRHRGDAEGHFVGAEVRRLCQGHRVSVLAPGVGRAAVWTETVVGLPGEEAFGFPGALNKLSREPWRALAAGRFVKSALDWLRHAPRPQRVVAHFLLPCGVPIATRGLRGHRSELEVVVHGSDARLFAKLPLVRDRLAQQLVSSNATVRCVSSELLELLLGSLSPGLRRELEPRTSVQPSPIDVDQAPARAEVRSALGLAAHAKIAVIVARLVPGKRVAVALEACRRVGGQLTTLVVGDGPERAALERAFPEVQFVGQLERPGALAYIAAADVLVSASLDEGAPSVVREARALGTPVVCLAAGDLLSWAETDPGLSVVS